MREATFEEIVEDLKRRVKSNEDTMHHLWDRIRKLEANTKKPKKRTKKE